MKPKYHHVNLGNNKRAIGSLRAAKEATILGLKPGQKLSVATANLDEICHGRLVSYARQIANGAGVEIGLSKATNFAYSFAKIGHQTHLLIRRNR
tara:strand:- start:330 stop:614 length:285 start_codon:yes stop_codon:yes gene_type:complete